MRIFILRGNITTCEIYDKKIKFQVELLVLLPRALLGTIKMTTVHKDNFTAYHHRYW